MGSNPTLSARFSIYAAAGQPDTLGAAFEFPPISPPRFRRAPMPDDSDPCYNFRIVRHFPLPHGNECLSRRNRENSNTINGKPAVHIEFTMPIREL